MIPLPLLLLGRGEFAEDVHDTLVCPVEFPGLEVQAPAEPDDVFGEVPGCLRFELGEGHGVHVGAGELLGEPVS